MTDVNDNLRRMHELAAQSRLTAAELTNTIINNRLSKMQADLEEIKRMLQELSAQRNGD